MRADIAKVIVERPRHRGDYRRVGRAANDYDAMPSKEGMRAPHIRNWSGKEFNDYLAPVRRFIEGTVGRRWDDVFSEICEHLGGGSTTQEHVLGHIDGYIAIKVIRCELSESKTGFVSHNALGNYRGRRSPVHHGELYVDPDDGIIKRAKLRVQTQLKVEPKTFHHIDRDHIAVKVKGIWYNTVVKPYTYERVTTQIAVTTPDGTTFRPVSRNCYICDGRITETVPDIYYVVMLRSFYGRPGAYGISKMQMDSKALRNYGLTNG